MLNILLTGASGFIGSHLLHALITKNYNVIVLLRSTSDCWRISNVDSKKYKRYDADKINLRQVFEENKINTIVHLAAYYSNKENVKENEQMLKSNVLFPIQLLDLACEYKVPYFINTGSYFEYQEDSKRSFYAQNKIWFETYLKQKVEQNQIEARTLKLFSPYGPKDQEHKIIPSLILNALQNKTAVVNDITNKLYLTYIDDVIDKYIKLVNNLYFFDNGSYNCIDYKGIGYTIQNIIKIIQQLLDTQINIQLNNNCTYSKISLPETNLCTQTYSCADFDLTQGLQKTIDYYREVLNENKINRTS